MNDERFSRTELLLGDCAEKIKNSRIAVFGLGGVGGYAVEALVRSGVGKIDLVDNDVVSISNINRQIIATEKTVGMLKTEVWKNRVLEINPEISVTTHNVFYLPDSSHLFNFSEYDYIIDAIDTVTGKIELVMQANKANVPIISSMGTGNKLNPLMLEVTDIYKTSVCPLAKVMRSELKKRGIKKLKVVYSRENPIKPQTQPCENGRYIPGSCAFVPSAAGIVIASEIIKDIIKRGDVSY